MIALSTSMKIPSTPTATEVLAMHGISSRKPPLATPPPSSLQNRIMSAEQIKILKRQSCVSESSLEDV
jgi:hypothetical protein